MSGSSELQGKMEQSLRGRLDNTEEIADYHRRLDSFAKILAAHSECIAVSVINGQFHITANELFKGSQENNQIFTSIKEIFDYFNQLAKGGSISDEQRKKIFCEKVCTASRFKSGYPSGLITKVAKSVFDREELTISGIIERYGANADLAAQMYILFTDLYEDFSKLEDVCKLSEEQFATLKEAFKRDPKILHEESVRGIHAEMQLLAKIVKENDSNDDFLDRNKDLYIGVSKLCCLHCRCMLETAREKLQQLDADSFLFRGRHDLNFKWESPEIFKEGYDSFNQPDITEAITMTSSSQQKSIAFSIGQEGHLLIESIKPQQKEFSSMVDSASESESGDKFDYNIQAQKKILEGRLEFIKNLIQQYGADDSSLLQILNITISLYELKSFINFTKSVISISNDEQKQEFLNNIIAELAATTGVKLTYDELEVIMGDANLVGEKLAKLFNEMKTRIDNLRLQHGTKRGRLAELETMPEENFSFNVKPQHIRFDDGDGITKPTQHLRFDYVKENLTGNSSTQSPSTNSFKKRR
jgi:hypothetical protein